MMSLDVFRGITIFGMILVNDPGSWEHIYPPLEHAPWNGWTHTDLIFPFFLFIAGVSMALSFSSRIARGDQRGDLLRHTLRRAAIIYFIGFCLALFPYFSDVDHWQRIRIMGVLQRIGVVYALAGTAYLYLSKKQRVVLIAVALIGYWMMMRFIPVPGFGAGNFWDGNHPDANLAAYLDRMILGHHLYRPTSDPEGLLSTILAACTALIGNFVGELLNQKSSWQKKVATLAIAGAIGMAIGEVLHPVFPINKNLWTSTYVLFTAGYAMLALAACYWIIDVRKWRAWCQPFLWLGMNAILVFTMSSWVAKNIYLIFKTTMPNGERESVEGWIYLRCFEPYFGDARNASLAFALSYVACWMLVMWWFYRRKIFVKV